MNCKIISLSQDKTILREKMHLSINRMRQLQQDLGMLDESGYPMYLPVADTPEKLQKLDELHRLILENDNRMLRFFDAEERKQILRSLPSQKINFREINDNNKTNHIPHDEMIFLLKEYPNVLIHMIETTNLQFSDESIEYLSENHFDILFLLIEKNANISSPQAIAVNNLSIADRPLSKGLVQSNTSHLKDYILGSDDIEDTNQLSLALNLNTKSSKHFKIIESINEILNNQYGAHEYIQRRIDLANCLISLYEDFGIETTDLEATRKSLTNEIFENYMFGDAINAFNSVFTYLVDSFQLHEVIPFEKRRGCSNEKINPDLLTEENQERLRSFNKYAEEANEVINDTLLTDKNLRLNLIDIYVEVKRICKRPWVERSFEDFKKQFPMLSDEQIKSVMVAPTQEDKVITMLLEIKKELLSDQLESTLDMETPPK